MSTKRYTLTVDLYVYADSDEEAINKALKFIHHQRELYDNGCDVLELHETPFASKESRKIEISNSKKLQYEEIRNTKH